MRYIADDGKIFDTEKECKDYEALFMSKKRIIPFDGDYSNGVLNIGTYRDIEPGATLSQLFEEVNIIYVPAEIYSDLLDIEDLPSEGLTVGLNIWDNENMMWINSRIIKARLESQLLDISNAEEIIKTLF